jgi:GNAT superfamily N-acetyltransferase
MKIELKNNRSFFIRLLEKTDSQNLFHYFSSLSPATTSRFFPHPFDKQTAQSICDNLPGDILRYVALDDTGTIVAYMLVKDSMVEEDRSRLLAKNIYFDQVITCTFAPSVTDSFQNTGLGSRMYDIIEKDILENTPWRIIVLWGGVQASNTRAVHFYEKKGFHNLGSFWNNNMDNYDMVRMLEREEGSKF